MLFLHEPNYCYARESTPLLVLQLGRARGGRARARAARARPPRGSIYTILLRLSARRAAPRAPFVPFLSRTPPSFLYLIFCNN